MRAAVVVQDGAKAKDSTVAGVDVRVVIGCAQDFELARLDVHEAIVREPAHDHKRLGARGSDQPTRIIRNRPVDHAVSLHDAGIDERCCRVEFEPAAVERKSPERRHAHRARGGDEPAVGDGDAAVGRIGDVKITGDFPGRAVAVHQYIAS